MAMYSELMINAKLKDDVTIDIRADIYYKLTEFDFFQIYHSTIDVMRIDGEEWIRGIATVAVSKENSIDDFLTAIKPYVDEGGMGVNDTYAMTFYEEYFEPKLYSLDSEDK